MVLQNTINKLSCLLWVTKWIPVSIFPIMNPESENNLLEKNLQEIIFKALTASSELSQTDLFHFYVTTI